jgi:hypothetical protein
VSVYGTGAWQIQRVAAFLGSRLLIIISLTEVSEYYHLSAKPAYLTTGPIPTGFTHHFRPMGCHLLLRPCITSTSRYGNINPLAIGYACRLRLRSRLTLIRLALIRKPGSYGEQVSHLFYRYLCLHLLFSPVHRSLPLRLHPRRECSPTRHTLHVYESAASVCVLMPAYYRCPVARPVSCYALFKGMAASKPTSWLSKQLDLLCST